MIGAIRASGKRWAVSSTVRPRLHRGADTVSTFLLSAPTSRCGTRDGMGGGSQRTGGKRWAVPSTVRPRLHRGAQTVSTFLLSAPTIRCYTRRGLRGGTHRKPGGNRWAFRPKFKQHATFNIFKVGLQRRNARLPRTLRPTIKSPRFLQRSQTPYRVQSNRQI